MISDSIPWKDELVRIAGRLEARAIQRRWTERTSYLVERDIMIAAFAVRKLIDSNKVSESSVRAELDVQVAKLTGVPADAWTAPSFYEHYSVDGLDSGRIGIRALANQIIHSLVFILSANDNEPHLFNGIYVSSDYMVDSQLLFVSVDTLALAFRLVGTDYPSAWQMDVNSKGRRIFRALP